MNIVYIVECKDGSLYTGWTKNLERRLDAHSSGKGAKYTRSRLPIKLVYYERFECESEARQREIAIKKLTRKQKLRLVNSQVQPVL